MRWGLFVHTDILYVQPINMTKVQIKINVGAKGPGEEKTSEEAKRKESKRGSQSDGGVGAQLS